MKKRVLSLLMALVLCLSLLPTAALADESESSGGESGGTATCDHGGTSGFDINATACPDCGTPAVAYTQLTDDKGSLWRNFASLQDALDADRDGGSTLGLLADVTGDYTINGTTDTGLDLNGCSINGTVTVTGEGGKETAFSNSKSTGTIQKVVASAGAKLAVSGAAAVIEKLTLAGGATWASILFLPRNPGYRVYTNYPDPSSYTWYAPTDVPAGTTELTNVSIKSLPITSKTLSLKVDGKNVSSVDRGTTVQLRAYCNTSGAEVTFYIQKGNDTTTWTISNNEVRYESNYYVADYTFDEMTSYTIWFTATKDGYSVTSNEKKLTVKKPSIPTSKITAPTAKTGLTYTGQPQELVTAGALDAKYGTIQYSLSRSGFSTEIPTKTDAGTYKVYYKVIGNDDYKDVNRTYNLTVTIAPKQIRGVNYTALSRPYTGSAEFTLTDTEKWSLTFFDADMRTVSLKPTDFEVSEGRFLAVKDGEYVASPEAGRKNAIELKVTLKNSNYELKGPNDAQPASSKKYTLNTSSNYYINQATIDLSKTGFTQIIYNDLEKTYEIDLKPMLEALLAQQTPAGVKYGTITYGTCSVNPTVDGYYDANNPAAVANGVLTLPIAAASGATGEIGTVIVPIETTNYEKFDLTIHLIAQSKVTPDQTSVTVSASDITYGQTLADSTLTVTGTMKDPRTGETVNGSFTWTDGTIKPDAGDSYEAEWTFTPANPEYAPTTGTVTINVARKDITGAVVTLNKNELMYTGQDIRPELVSVVLDGVTLTEGIQKDYEYMYLCGSAVGSYSVRVRGCNNYTGEAMATWEITPRPVTPKITVADGVYNGGNPVEPTVTLTDDLGNTIDQKEYKAAYSNNINAGTGTVTVTDDHPNGNYVISTVSENFTISKAAAPANIQTGRLNVINGTKLEYAYDAKQLLPAAPKGEYGKVIYGVVIFDLENGYTVDGENGTKIENGILTLTIEAPEKGITGKIGTIPVEVVTDNYKNFTLPIDLYAVDKITPVADGEITASEITYGDELSKSTITGKMKDPDNAEVKGTFAWTEPSTKPNAGGFDAEWVFTPDSPKYATVTGKVTVTVKRATIPEEQVTVKQKGTLTYNGSEQVAEVEITGAEGLGTITLLYAIRDDYGHNPTVPAFTDAGTHQVHYTVYSQNYDIPSGYFTVTIEPKTVTDPTVIVNGGPFTYDDGSEIKPAVTVKDGGTEISGREYTVSYRDNINAGTATVTIMDKEGGNYVLGTVSETFAIGKAAAGVKTAPAAQTLTYNGNGQQLVTAGEALGGTMVYSLDGKTYGGDIPTAVNAGEYTVWYKVAGDSNHNDTAAASVTVTIGRADAKVITAPAAVGGLVYSGAEQQLVTAGEALGGTMVYSLDGKIYGGDIPTAVNAGEYTVYYKVEGDSNHNDTAAASVTVTIARAKLTGKVTCRTFPRYGYTLGDTHITAPALWPEGSFQWYDENGKALADSTMIVSDATYRWVFRDDLGNYEPVNGSIVLWRYAPEAAETGKSETVKNPDGSTTTTVTKPDGTVTETTTTPDGTTSTTTTDKDGNTDTDVKVSDKAVSDAKKDGSTIKLPVDGRPGQEIDIDIRTGGEDVTIEIPVSGATGGTVAIIVKGDGTEEVVRESVVTGDGIRMKVSGSVTVKVADRSKDFIDMRGHWAKNEADTVVARGLFNGTSDTMFSPSLPMTRGMVVTVLARMSGADTSGGAKWYDKGCAWAVANDISDGTAPESSITREQLVTMLYRYAKLRGVDVTAGGTALQSFSDYESVSSYAVEAMDWAVTKGLVNGINGRLEPQGTATRAQVAAIFARFLKLL